jgi:hypothetical protein
MSYFNKIAFFVIALCASLILSCSKSSSPTDNTGAETLKITFTLNGGSFTGNTYTFDAGGVGIYLESSKTTGLTFSSSNIQDGATITFPGQVAGTFPFGSTATKAVMLINLNSISNIVAVDSGTLVVTSFASTIGGNIVGTFSGTGKDMKNQTIQVTNGSFTAKRSN